MIYLCSINFVNEDVSNFNFHILYREVFFFFLKTCEQNLQQAIIVLTDHSLFIGYICQENLFNFYIYFQ